MLSFNTSDINVTQTVYPTQENGFTSVYVLSNGTTYSQYDQVIDSSKILTFLRLVEIATHSLTVFILCAHNSYSKLFFTLSYN